MAKEENKRAKHCPNTRSLIKGQYDSIRDKKFLAIKQRITKLPSSLLIAESPVK